MMDSTSIPTKESSVVKKFLRELIFNKVTKRIGYLTAVYVLFLIIPVDINLKEIILLWTSVAIFFGAFLYYGTIIYSRVKQNYMVGTPLIGLFYNSLIATLAVGVIAIVADQIRDREITLIFTFAALAFYYAWIFLIVAFEGSKE